MLLVSFAVAEGQWLKQLGLSPYAGVANLPPVLIFSKDANAAKYLICAQI
jgi:hypothetical protein